MDIGSSFDGLRSLLGVNSAAPASTPARSGPAPSNGALGSDLATLSSAANEVSQTAGGDNVRLDKVAQIQAALASGTYFVPASAVASKVVDSMLGAGLGTGLAANS
jgi:negative regulator of flagellin synthesis FlgM